MEKLLFAINIDNPEFDEGTSDTLIQTYDEPEASLVAKLSPIEDDRMYIWKNRDILS